jgi:hypothetical protein
MQATSRLSVAVLVNVETTPVQLHATLFPSGDTAGRGTSSYFALIVLKLVPLAHEAFLGLAGVNGCRLYRVRTSRCKPKS